MIELGSTLQKLGFRSREGAESDRDVAKFEHDIGIILPLDYRNFLLEIGGGYIDVCKMNCVEPTPFGSMNILSFATLNSIYRLLDSEIVPSEMIVIGHGHFGMETCLSLGRNDFGSVYALDVEQRRDWTAKTLKKLPHLAPEIKEFFRLRDEGKLATREPIYDHCYLVSQSFSTFIFGLTLVTP